MQQKCSCLAVRSLFCITSFCAKLRSRSHILPPVEAGLRTGGHYGAVTLLHTGRPQLWLRSTITIRLKAGTQLRGQQNSPSPNMLCSKHTTLQTHKGFLRERRETWRIMEKTDTVRRAKEWRSFFRNYLGCSLWYFLFENKYFALLNLEHVASLVE